MAQLFGLPLGKLQTGRLKSPSLETWTWEQAMAADWSLECSCRCPWEGVVLYWDWLEPSSRFLMQRLPQQGRPKIDLFVSQRVRPCHTGCYLSRFWQIGYVRPLNPSGLSVLTHHCRYFFRVLVSCFQPHHCGPWNSSAYSVWTDHPALSIILSWPTHISKAVWSLNADIPRKGLSFLPG